MILLPFLVVAGAIACIVIATLVNKQQDKRTGQERNPTLTQIGEYYRRWRIMIFGVTPESVEISQDAPDTVYGVILDVGMYDRRTRAEFAISMTAFPTGEASFHPTPGNSIVGMGNHPPVAQIARQIVQAAQGLWHETNPARELSLPKPGLVRFFFLTTSGVRFFEGKLSEVQTRDHPFGKLLYQFGRIRGFAERQIDQSRASTESSGPGEEGV